MDNHFDINILLQKPIAMMTGEELIFLINNACERMNVKVSNTTKQKRIFYGIEGIAKVFGCSVPTANRIKKSGVIDEAITQVGRKIVVDADLALELAKKAGNIRIRQN
jgi:hypothetical protein